MSWLVKNGTKINLLKPFLKTVVLKLGVAKLFRVAKFQKRVAKLWNRENLAFNGSNKPKIKVWQGIITSRGAQDFLRVARFLKASLRFVSKKVWEPLPYDNSLYYELSFMFQNWSARVNIHGRNQSQSFVNVNKSNFNVFQL